MRQWGFDSAQAFAIAYGIALGRDLKPAIDTAVRSILPLKIGPFTISLSGVSVDFFRLPVPPGVAAPSAPTTPIGGPSVVGEFQHGGMFRVGGSGGVDSQLVRFRAT